MFLWFQVISPHELSPQGKSPHKSRFASLGWKRLLHAMFAPHSSLSRFAPLVMCMLAPQVGSQDRYGEAAAAGYATGAQCMIAPHSALGCKGEAAAAGYAAGVRCVCLRRAVYDRPVRRFARLIETICIISHILYWTLNNRTTKDVCTII